MIHSLFITGTGTSAGKTFVARGLASALVRASRQVVALKPIETGVDSEPLDALALAAACGRPHLANAPGLYRARLPLSPYAAALESGASPPQLAALVNRVRDLAAGSDVLLVEGAGGLLVPIDAHATLAEFAALLALPLLIVARDQLGVLSSVLTCVESAQRRHLPITAVVLVEHERGNEHDADASRRSNRRILDERLGLPVLSFPACEDNDSALAAAAESCGLVALVLRGALAR